MNAELIEKIKEYVAECSYDPSGQMIWTKERKHLCDIRGWGHLQNKFSTEDEAAIFQDGIGKFIEDAINEKVLRVAESNTWVSVDSEMFKILPLDNRRHLLLTEDGRMFHNQEDFPNKLITHVFVIPTPPSK